MVTHYDPDDKFSMMDIREVNPPQWMLEVLKINPDYTGWGPGDDCMGGKGWQEPLYFNNWEDFKFPLDDLNELVNFYFDADRDEDKDECYLSLVLWILHPRKGASRGVCIKNINQEDLPEVYDYLRKARERNDKRFSGLG